MIRERENAPTITVTATTTTATTTTTTRLIEQLDKANQIFNMAISISSSGNEQRRRRKELLEQALVAYADTLPYASPVISRVIIKQIHAIEQWLELLISDPNDNSISSSSSNSTLEEDRRSGSNLINNLT